MDNAIGVPDTYPLDSDLAVDSAFQLLNNWGLYVKLTGISLLSQQTLLPKVIDFVNDIINRQLSFGYDVGKGYIIAEEEVIKLIDHMVVDKRIARDLKQRSEQNRLDVVKSLGTCVFISLLNTPCFL